ncbi:MAG: hypothetical protein ACLFQP_05545 [Halothece sp.]
MKSIHILINSILTISLVSVSQVALAGEISASSSEAVRNEIEPFNLVQRAYSGDFSDEGIPGFNRLITACQTGGVCAEDLVKTAIEQERLPQDTLNNEEYLQAVEFQLQNLEQERYHD